MENQNNFTKLTDEELLNIAGGMSAGTLLGNITGYFVGVFVGTVVNYGEIPFR